MAVKSRDRALVVGIDAYPASPLGGCCNDAREVAALLADAPFNFDVTLLLDAAATKSAVRDAVSSLLSSANRAVFFFAGHGAQTDLGTYLATIDGTKDDEGFDLEQLRKLITARGAACALVLLLLDCCHSGAARPRSLASPSFQPLRAEALARALDFSADGRVLLAACRADQSAHETAAGDHGVFTTHLLAGLRGGAADQTGSVTVHTLYEYISRELRQTNQTPVFRGDVAGRAILGAGLPPGGFSAPSEATALSDLAAEAQRHLTDYQARLTALSSDLNKWKVSGYASACELLLPITQWFDRKSEQHPKLKVVDLYRTQSDALTARLQGLSTMERGLNTRFGVVDDHLGSGSFGAVWKVRRADGTHRVIKVYHPNDLRDREKRQRFHRGYEAMRQLDHPNIVHVGEFTNCPVAFDMDYIDGSNLRNFHGGSSEPAELVRILLIVAETLQHAHGRGVVHRDVKPENIIMQYTDDGYKPHLTDFDLAWFSTATKVTKEAIGTVFYAAPEQLSKPASQIAHAHTTDVYAFGQVMFFLLTGSDPIPLEQADNQKAFVGRLDARYTQGAAERILKLYQACTQTDPRHRIADFRHISDILFKIQSSLVSRDERAKLPLIQFLSELRFSLVGLVPTGVDEESFLSLSRRTRVTPVATETATEQLLVELNFVPFEPLSMEGLSNASMRTALNQRLDAALGAFPVARRRSGKQGTYEVYVDVTGINPNRNGVAMCREIVSRVIDVLER